MVNQNAAADAITAAMARNWGWMLMRGLLGLIVGGIAIVLPMAALGGLILVFAVYAAADGIAAIVAAFGAMRHNQSWGWLLVEGVIGLGAAAAALFLPGIAVISFIYIIGFWAIFSGISMLIAAFGLRLDPGRWWLVFGGLLSLAFGAMLLFQPGIGALVMTMWFGVYALLFGIVLVIFAFKLRSLAGSASAT